MEGKEKTNPLPYPEWLCGFTDGDGSFHGILRKQKEYRCNYQVQAVFDLAQKEPIEKDFSLINKLFFNGKASFSTVDSIGYLRVVSFKEHEKRIIPFFKKYRLQSRKSLDFLVYLKMCNLIKKGNHLTTDGIRKWRMYTRIQRQ